MPQKMRRNATRNISAPTGKTAVIKMPSPSANAHSPTQRHGPDGGRGGGFGTMLLPPLPAFACSILYKSGRRVPALS